MRVKSSTMATRARMRQMMRQETKGPSYMRAGRQLLLSLDDALEDFSFQIDAHTVLTPGWVTTSWRIGRTQTTNIPCGRRIHSRVSLQMGAAKRIFPEKCLCKARFEGADIVRK